MIDYLVFALLMVFVIKNHYVCWKVIKELDKESLESDRK